MIISQAKNNIDKKSHLEEVISSTIFLALSLLFLYLQIQYVQLSAYLISFVLFLVLGVSGYSNIILSIIKDRYYKYKPSVYKNSTQTTLKGHKNVHKSLKPKNTVKCPLCYTKYPKNTIHTRCIHCHTPLPKKKSQ